MKITFCGAAESVTGSCHLVTTKNYKILLDCGQFQGNKETEAKNLEEFPFDPSEVDFMLLSHAHIDHSGRIPLLIKKGFRGTIYSTDATADLLKVMLMDSAYIHEQEAEWQSRKNLRAGKAPAEPLYTCKDAETALQFVSPVLYGQYLELAPGIHAVFNDAGHILGSSIIELFIDEGEGETKLVFSGDLGVKGRPILRDPTVIKKADYLIMETTYGNRARDKGGDRIETLIDIVAKTVKRGGNVIIPCFAVGRTQELIFEFNRYYEEHTRYKELLDHVPFYVDSPMATSVTEVFRRNAQVFDDETKEYILKGDNPLDFKNLKFTRSSEESRFLNMDSTPKIILSASGMCEAGRIKHHLKHNLWDAKNSIVFVGYQAEGTLGRSLAQGDKDVTIFGEKIHVNAEIYNLEGFSGHADRDGLLEWLGSFEKKPVAVFLVHGEPEAKKTFASSAKMALGCNCIPITAVSEYELSKDALLSSREIKKNFTEKEAEVHEIRQRTAAVHRQMEQILYNANLAIDEKTPSKKLKTLQNYLLELEKSTMNFGSALIQEEPEE
ncbi:MAG: MBL fold metallo-hydrolase [Firmicutes bacterium]|nr:MBL fold metallo-hydrolase [Bacillota bacterium]